MNKSTNSNTSQNKAFQKDREQIKNALCNELALLEQHPVFFDDFEQKIKELRPQSTAKQRATVISKINDAIQLINKTLSNLQLITFKSNSKNINEVKDELNNILIRVRTQKKLALLNCLENHRQVTT